jgi:hypothetical protein
VGRLTFGMVGVISQNFQTRILMWASKNPKTLKREFLICSNKDPKIEARSAQVCNYLFIFGLMM